MYLKFVTCLISPQCCLLSINGRAGPGVRGTAPEVPGEGYRPAYLCAEIQEAPHCVPQAGVAPSRWSDISPLMSMGCRTGRTVGDQLCCIPAHSILVIRSAWPCFLSAAYCRAFDQTWNGVCMYSCVLRNVLPIRCPAEWTSWVGVRWSNCQTRCLKPLL